MYQVMGYINENGKTRVYQIETNRFSPHVWMKMFQERCHLNNASVKMGNLRYDPVRETFYAQEYVFEVVDGKVQTNSLRAI